MLKGDDTIAIDGKLFGEVDAVCDEHSTADDVHTESRLEEIIKSACLRGINGAIIAYGQTGR